MLESVRTERPQRLLRMGKSSRHKVSTKSGGLQSEAEDRDMYLGAQLEQGQTWTVLTSVLKVRSTTNKKPYTDRKFSLLDILFSWML
jgi:hypothetical protein